MDQANLAITLLVCLITAGLIIAYKSEKRGVVFFCLMLALISVIVLILLLLLLLSSKENFNGYF